MPGEHTCPRAHVMNFTTMRMFEFQARAVQIQVSVEKVNYVEKVLNSRISHGLISWNMSKIACVICNRLFRSQHVPPGKLNYVDISR